MSETDARGLTAPAPLAPEHELQDFNSDTEQLDMWLRQRTRQNEASGASRTYVIAEGRRVVGYYSLAAGSVLHAAATGRVRRNMPDPVPVALLGDSQSTGNGREGGSARRCCATPCYAVLRVVGAAGTIGVRALLVCSYRFGRPQRLPYPSVLCASSIVIISVIGSVAELPKAMVPVEGLRIIGNRMHGRSRRVPRRRCRRPGDRPLRI